MLLSCSLQTFILPSRRIHPTSGSARENGHGCARESDRDHGHVYVCHRDFDQQNLYWNIHQSGRDYGRGNDRTADDRCVRSTESDPPVAR